MNIPQIIVNGKPLKMGDEVIYLLERGADHRRLPARVVKITPRRVVIRCLQWKRLRSVMWKNLEGADIVIPVKNLTATYDPTEHELEDIGYRIKNGFKDNPEYDKADVVAELKKFQRRILERVEFIGSHADGPEHNSYYEVMDYLDKQIKILRKS